MLLATEETNTEKEQKQEEAAVLNVELLRDCLEEDGNMSHDPEQSALFSI
ncbi:hypothetical protein GCM10009122_04190 [Fulvivirga kasyanovii]